MFGYPTMRRIGLRVMRAKANEKRDESSSAAKLVRVW